MYPKIILSSIRKFHCFFVLFGSALALSLVFGFTSCSSDDDDPNDMISGSNNNYYISYTNTTTDVSRGYNDTIFNHYGAMVTISMSNATGNVTGVSAGADGVMGFIWDLKTKTATDGKELKDFFVIAIRSDAKYYVSKFENVANIQAYNFGYSDEPDSTIAAYGTKETQIVPETGVFKTISGGLRNASEAGYDKQVTVKIVANDNGSYTVKLFNDEAEAAEDSTVEPLDTPVEISNEKTGYSEKKQNKLAVYANVYAGGSLNGHWKFNDTYGAAEVIEE